MRYLALIVLNIPIIFLAFLSITTKYKLGVISRRRFYQQVILWFTILLVIISSFPVYNLFHNRQVLDSLDLSVFDILQTTLIILLIYIANDQRQRINTTERRLRDLHQELSIKMSNHDK